MNSMADVLSELRNSVAVKGCLLMMHDGIVVTSVLEDHLDADNVSGLTSFLTSTLRRTLNEADMGAFSSFTVHSTHGKILAVDVGESYLVILTNQFGKLDMSMPEIQEAALQLRRLSRISL